MEKDTRKVKFIKTDTDTKYPFQFQTPKFTQTHRLQSIGRTLRQPEVFKQRCFVRELFFVTFIKDGRYWVVKFDDRQMRIKARTFTGATRAVGRRIKRKFIALRHQKIVASERMLKAKSPAIFEEDYRQNVQFDNNRDIMEVVEADLNHHYDDELQRLVLGPGRVKVDNELIKIDGDILRGGPGTVTRGDTNV